MYSEYSQELRTQSYRAQVFKVIAENVLLPILTDCGAWVRNSRIQLQRRLLSLRYRNLEKCLVGIIELKAELIKMLDSYSRSLE